MPRKAEFSIFADCRCTVGEGPLWSDKEKMLYWVDIVEGAVFRKSIDNDCKDFDRFQLDIGKIGGMTLAGNNSFLLFAEKGKVWKWTPAAEPTLYTELPEASNSRFNDVIADMNGNIFCGVAPVEKGGEGSLWMMKPDRSFVCIESHAKGMPNGMGFSPDRKYFYFTVSDEKIIYRYDYDSATGKLSNKKKFIDTSNLAGVPDGMTVDSEGNLWSAQWDGAKLMKYSTDGDIMGAFEFPINKLTSVIAIDNSIYITTANYPWIEGDYQQDNSGSLLKLINR